ncbi:MAG TPA: DUF305 domain-containing protein [Longimicrobiales bacterium]|nr:DUF305 domain-containing protein [Longimicrobiales bacterium]
MKHLMAAGVLALAATWTAACATTQPAGGAGALPAAGPVGMSADSAAALEALFRQRLETARGRYTEADVRFMTDMIHHHGQAVHMAELVPERSMHPGVLALAARIRVGQLDEIAAMQQWLRERGRPAPDHTAGPDAHGHHGQHGAMAGMLTAAQLAELERARGDEFDRLFLSFMIEHHRGAVAMVDSLLEADGAAQDAVVFRLASDIHVEQTTEIGRMQRMLAVLLGVRG